MTWGISNIPLFWGKVEVTTNVVAFQKRKVFSGETLGIEKLSLPPQIFQTEGLWFCIPKEIISKLKLNDLEVAGGIHGIEHGAISLLPVYALCDRRDIGGVSTPHHYQLKEIAIFIYDGVEGGIGISKRGYEVFKEHMVTTLELIEGCGCEEGCPSCIHSPKCGNWNEPLSKKSAINILKEIIG